MNTPILETEFIVCDVETTGLSPSSNRITEIALIRVINGEITERFSTLVNPEQHIPYGITALTGISNEDVFDKPPFKEIAPAISSFFGDGTEKNVVFAGHNAAFDYKFLQHSFARTEKFFDMKVLCTCKLARRLLRRLRSKSLINVASYFGIKFDRQHRAYDDALATAKILINFLDILQGDFEFDKTSDILKFQNTRIYTNENKSPALKRINMSLKDFPRKPGVYFMNDRNGDILYIGKAKDLRERLSSYFRHNSELPPRTTRLMQQVASVDYEITGSELSALILESKLIKQHKPRFNSAMKRFRFHPFLKIDVQNEYPKIEKVYEIENDGANYYGPFSSGMTVNRLLKDINERFFLRKCEAGKLKPSPQHPTCMYLEMKKCNAPCNFSESKHKYAEQVRKVHDFLVSDNGVSAQGMYEEMMNQHAEEMEFERAAFLRDRLNDIRKVMSCQKVITPAINGKKIIIKCNGGSVTEFFFIQNGKLVKTFRADNEGEFDQRDIADELTETTEYLYFSLSKFVKHKFTPQELDEIKVISNWLALNRDRNSVLEIGEQHSKEDVMKFLSSGTDILKGAACE